MRSPGAVLDFIRDEGPGVFLKRVAETAVSAVYRDRTVFLDRDLDDDPHPPAQDGVVFGPIDLPGALALRSGLYLDEPVVRHRFERGDQLLAAREGDALMAYAWFSSGGEWLTTVERRFEIEPGERYVYNVRTMPAYRGRGLFPALVALAVPHFRNQGCPRFVTVVEAANAPSLRAFEKAGFRRWRSLRLRRVLGSRRYEERALRDDGNPDIETR